MCACFLLTPATRRILNNKLTKSIVLERHALTLLELSRRTVSQTQLSQHLSKESGDYRLSGPRIACEEPVVARRDAHTSTAAAAAEATAWTECRTRRLL